MDDVLPQTALAAWRKFDQFDTASDSLKWSLVFADSETIEFRRAMGCDRLGFSEEMLELVAAEAMAEPKQLKTTK